MTLQLLAGGPAHLRPVDEFTVRLCYVCFDGAEALEASRQLGLSTDLPQDFVQKYCGNVYHGIKVSQVTKKTCYLHIKVACDQKGHVK